jgi:hypothetical protein
MCVLLVAIWIQIRVVWADYAPRRARMIDGVDERHRFGCIAVLAPLRRCISASRVGFSRALTGVRPGHDLARPVAVASGVRRSPVKCVEHRPLELWSDSACAGYSAPSARWGSRAAGASRALMPRLQTLDVREAAAGSQAFVRSRGCVRRAGQHQKRDAGRATATDPSLEANLGHAQGGQPKRLSGRATAGGWATSCAMSIPESSSAGIRNSFNRAPKLVSRATDNTPSAWRETVCSARF